MVKVQVQQDTKSDDCKFTVICTILYGNQILVMINCLKHANNRNKILDGYRKLCMTTELNTLHDE